MELIDVLGDVYGDVQFMFGTNVRLHRNIHFKHKINYPHELQSWSKILAHISLPLQ